MKAFTKKFMLCGIAGWCWECFWSGMHSMWKKEKELFCKTSIWMFPIYGMAACLLPICKCCKKRCLVIRSMIYALCIFLGEYLSGTWLKKRRACPWNYSKAKFNIKGVIRLDYLPFWMLAGVLFEKILMSDCKEECACEDEKKRASKKGKRAKKCVKCA